MSEQELKKDRRNTKRGDDLLKVEDLYVEYSAGKKIVHAVNGVSFEIKRGEALALVGESGCGKSTIAKALLRILPDRGSKMKGKILFEGEDLIAIPEKEMEHIRGGKISMVFQDPMTALNPVKRILTQVSSVIRLHHPGMSKRDAEERAMKMLETVGITRDRVRDYPHQFSGGQQQRVVVAIGLSCDPDLLLADEPTTALDVTIQAQILELMRSLQKDYGMSILYITHDLGTVAQMCDYVAVMYLGRIVEYADVNEIFKNPVHPYTKGLMGSVHKIGGESKRLFSIEGTVPVAMNLPDRCGFYDRCTGRDEKRCAGCEPVMTEVAPGHFAACHLCDKKEEKG